MSPARVSLVVLAALGVSHVFAAESLDDAIRRTALDYAQRTESAGQELNRTRETIADAEAPLAKSLRELQDRIVALETEIARLESDQSGAAGNLSRLQRDSEALKRNLNYVTTQGFEAFKGFSDSLLPGEKMLLSERIEMLQHQFEDPVHPAEPRVALETLDLFTAHITRAAGGYLATGSSLVGADNQLRSGTFAFTGPQAFFQTGEGDARGLVRGRDGGGVHPLTHSLPRWQKEKAAPLFQGQMATIPADSSGGKALRLQEITGTYREHIHKGGTVAYLIIAVGVLALVIMILKVVDAQNLRVDESERVRNFLQAVAQGKIGEAERLLPALAATTRETFSRGLQHIGKTKDSLEEHLSAVVQEQRLHFERRLPLLTVIATASPLLGLLGTVMGMVKTFALITVFGTGNAAKLSSGISEVLVTTELGLAVAIPALVAHGFLAHRIHKKLSVLERQASEFAAAAEESRAAGHTLRPALV
ncbi:MAG TPA: MotA/TolQ/ExbB proton channel family protein [Opitutaceae bacterium]|nr:MotA/TolQ/ExbB proton channel family protein [Opitutaceae bacterium]